MDSRDEASEVRAEDAVDVAALSRWLSAQGIGGDGIPEVRQFGGGASNLTYLLSYAGGPALVLRRPPAGTKARGAHDMRREHDLQAALAPVFPLVPRMVGFCADEAVLGSEFYVMEAVPGVILRRDPPPGLTLDAKQVHRLGETFVDALVALHGVDVEAAGLGSLGRGPGYVGRQLDGWSTRYRAARTPDVGDFEEVIAWLSARAPGDVGKVLIHNDFRFDNLVLDPGTLDVRAVLDWEMATVGDPLMDLGGALAYWAEAGDDPAFRSLRRQPTHLPGMPTRWEVVSAYADRTGRTVSREDWSFYEVFGLFRLAGIAQQIYYRFFHGQTTNPAYAAFKEYVVLLERRCLERL